MIETYLENDCNMTEYIHATFADTGCNISEQRLQHHRAPPPAAASSVPGWRDLLAATKEMRRWRAVAARLARSRPRRAAAGARLPSSRREPPTRECSEHGLICHLFGV
jgi:hypothetical protein